MFFCQVTNLAKNCFVFEGVARFLLVGSCGGIALPFSMAGLKPFAFCGVKKVGGKAGRAAGRVSASNFVPFGFWDFQPIIAIFVEHIGA